MFAIPGAGKTKGFLDIARKCPDVTFWILDNDNSIDRLLETEYEDLKIRAEWERGEWYDEEEDGYGNGNLVVLHTRDWDEHAWALAYVEEECSRDDWFLIDTATRLWDDVQEWFIDKMYGTDKADLLLAYKATVKKSGGKEVTASEAQFTDWQFINPVYFKEVNNRLINFPCHVYITAEQTEVTPFDKDKVIKDLYSGVKPKGQKKLSYIVSTILNLKRKATGEFIATTLKDRGRVELDGEEIGDDFAKWYLWEIAGWRPKKVEVE